MDEYICRPCRRGPLPQSYWRTRIDNGNAVYYCPYCRCRVMLTRETEQVTVLDLNGDFSWQIDIGNPVG